MGLTTERLALLIDADAKGAIREMEKLGDTARRELGGMEAKLDRTASRMTTFGATAVGVAGIATVGLYDMADAAGDLAETQDKVRLVFGESADAILEWGETSNEQFGIARRDALDAAATFGIFGDAAGLTGEDLTGFSEELTKLAGDFASLNNVDADVAIQAIGAALRGENEPIRQFGVLLDDATLKARAMELGLISTTTQALTPQQKVLASHAEIMEQGIIAQDNYINTSGSLANQTRNLGNQFQELKEDIGKGLVPIFSTLVGTGSDVIGVVGGLDGATQGLIGQIAGIATAGLGAAGAVSFLGGQTIKMRDRFIDAESTATSLAGRMTTMGRIAAGAGVIGGVVALAGALLDLASASDEADGSVDSLGTTLAEEGADAAVDDFIEDISSIKAEIEALNNTDIDLDTLEGVMAQSNLDSAVSNLADSLNDFGVELQALDPDSATAIFDALAESGALSASEVDNLRGNYDDFILTSGALQDQQEGLSSAIADVGDSAGDAAPSFESLADEASPLAQMFDEIDEKTRDLMEAYDLVSGRVMDVHEANLSFRQGLADLPDAIDATSRSLNENSLAGITNVTAFDSVIDKANEWYEAELASGVPTDVAAANHQRHVDELLGVFEQLGFNRDELALYYLALTPLNTTITTTIRLDAEITAKASAALDAISLLDRSYLVTGRASGGPVSSGQPYIVGEEGPEWFVPDGSGTILPNGVAPSAPRGGVSGGAGINVTNYITCPSADPASIVDALRVGVRQGLVAAGVVT